MLQAMYRATILFAHLIFILTPILLGWGVADLPAFFRDPVRSLFLVAIVLGSLAVLLLGIDLSPLRTGSRASRTESATLFALAAISIALLWFLPYADRHHIAVISQSLGFPARWLGLILTCAGGIIRLLALRQLGQHFSAYVTLQPDHRLVQTGIYRWVRHPLYLSLLLAGPGVALIFASQLLWPILAVALLFISKRINQEDKLLQHTFPHQFATYRQKTPRLLPFLF
jgi:protein-S-isoprenylcysteine O-methyltransferase Ste14